MRGDSTSKLGIYIIFLGAVFVLLGTLFDAIGDSSYISANERWIDALEDSDQDDLVNAYKEQNNAYKTSMVASILSGLGLFIIFFGIGITFFSDYNEPSPSKENERNIPSSMISMPMRTESEGKYCISCGKKIPIDASFCPYCNHNQKLEPRQNNP